MYALVESGSITKYFNYPKGFTLGDLQYSGDIFLKFLVCLKFVKAIQLIHSTDLPKNDSTNFESQNFEGPTLGWRANS